jgi:hypothetical protein
MTRRKKFNPYNNLYYNINGRVYRVLLYYNTPIAAYTKTNILLKPNGRLDCQLAALARQQISCLELLTIGN